MAIKLHLCGLCRELTGERESIVVSGNTVGECLKDSVRQFPAVEKELFCKGGKLLESISVAVNSEVTFHDELNIPVKDGDEIHLLPLIAGG